MARALRQYVGVIHVHSDKSDGEATLQEIVAAAKVNDVDFVVLTDHQTRGYAWEVDEGWHDGVLILCGEEVTTPQGHFLAFETREDVGDKMDLPDAVAEVHRQAGFTVSIHAQLPKSRLVLPPLPFPEADGVEIWSFTDEFLARADPRTIVTSLARPDRAIIGPERPMLNKWDVELGRRMMPAIGGLNAHQRKAPLLEWKQVLPMKTTFGTIHTIIQSRELPKVALRARDMVWESLRKGRSFIANQSIAPAKGFDFYFRDPKGRVVGMGGESEFVPGGRVHVKLPAEGELSIRHNGQPLFWGTGVDVDFPAPTPGVYRIEVRLNRRVWIISNPIRLTIDNQPVQPTVSDFT